MGCAITSIVAGSKYGTRRGLDEMQLAAGIAGDGLVAVLVLGGDGLRHPALDLVAGDRTFEKKRGHAPVKKGPSGRL